MRAIFSRLKPALLLSTLSLLSACYFPFKWDKGDIEQRAVTPLLDAAAPDVPGIRY